jgi:putative CocE/NonD family hydrolase
MYAEPALRMAHGTWNSVRKKWKTAEKLWTGLSAQPWSNQKVGSTGISYLGTTAEMLLVNQHPNVKACIPRSSIFDLYNDIAFPGGVRHGKFIEVWRDTTLSLDKNNLKYIGAVANAVIKNPKPVKADTKGGTI